MKNPPFATYKEAYVYRLSQLLKLVTEKNRSMEQVYFHGQEKDSWCLHMMERGDYREMYIDYLSQNQANYERILMEQSEVELRDYKNQLEQELHDLELKYDGSVKDLVVKQKEGCWEGVSSVDFLEFLNVLLQSNPVTKIDPQDFGVQPYIHPDTGKYDWFGYVGNVRLGNQSLDGFLAGCGAIWNTIAGVLNSATALVGYTYSGLDELCQYTIGMSLDDALTAIGPAGMEIDLAIDTVKELRALAVSLQGLKALEAEGKVGAKIIAFKVGTYSANIKWGILEIEARPFGKGFWGQRVKQPNIRIDAYELKINPNNESFYLESPEGGYVQFENLKIDTLQDGKLVMDQSSIYHVLDKPPFLREEAILNPAKRQLLAAKKAGYQIEWLVSEQKAVDQLTTYFFDNNIDIVVRLLKE